MSAEYWQRISFARLENNTDQWTKTDKQSLISERGRSANADCKQPADCEQDSCWLSGDRGEITERNIRQCQEIYYKDSQSFKTWGLIHFQPTFLILKNNESRLMRSPWCLCVCICSSILLLGNGSVKTELRETHSHATREEFLDASFSMRFVSYQRKVGDCFFPKLLFLSGSRTVSNL
jgi:hypothetical protein